MHIRTVPARHGWLWFKLGFQICGRQPVAWTLLFFPFVLGHVMLDFQPWVGPALQMAWLPLQALLMMVVSAHLRLGQRLSPAALWKALRCSRGRCLSQLALCALYPAAALAALALATPFDGGDLAAFVLRLAPGSRAAATIQLDAAVTLCWIAWISALTLLFWPAPGLVHWHGIALFHALWLSMAACLRNWRALLVFTLTWIGVGSLVVLGCSLLLGRVKLPMLLMAAFPHIAPMGPWESSFLPMVSMWLEPMGAAAAAIFSDCFCATQAPPAASSSPRLDTA